MDLADIIERFRGPLIGLIASWGATSFDAAEIAQDSFADAYLNRHSCRGDWKDPEVFGAWLRGIARNRFRNECRRRKTRSARVISISTAEIDESTPCLTDPVDERMEQLRDAIDNLPSKLKQVVMMHYLETTSVKEVAELLSVSPKTVEGRLYQARRQLKRMMGEKSTSGITKLLLL